MKNETTPSLFDEPVTSTPLTIDPNAPLAERMRPRTLDEFVGQETTSSLAARHGALAAVNAGFFRVGGTYRGESDGLMVLQGKVLSEPARGGSALALTNVAQTGSYLQLTIQIIEGDYKIRGGMCPNGHGLMEPTDYGQRCPACGFFCNTPADRVAAQ